MRRCPNSGSSSICSICWLVLFNRLANVENKKMIIPRVGVLSCAILLSVIGGGASNAATIQNFDSGWYTNSGFTAGVTNINVGSSNLSGAVYHIGLPSTSRVWLARTSPPQRSRSMVETELIPPPPAKPWDFSIIPAASMPSSAIRKTMSDLYRSGQRQ